MQFLRGGPADIQHLVHLIDRPRHAAAEAMTDRCLADSQHFGQIHLTDAELAVLLSKSLWWLRGLFSNSYPTFCPTVGIIRIRVK